MKLDFPAGASGWLQPALADCRVESEVHRLTDVLLCPPSHLAPVPCCSVTRESLRAGFEVSVATATEQHDRLRATLERHGVRCHILPPDPRLPDMCFTRDVMLTTPWGVVALRPSARHRRAEATAAIDFCHSLGAHSAFRIEQGTIEGGDIAIVHPGLVIIGCSDERTSEAGATELAAIFRERGWDALVYAFDPHFLHLDTQFCMVAPGLALACTDVLDDAFLTALAARDIELIPVGYKEARRLGCNVLSLGNGTILSSAANERVNRALAARGFTVECLAIDQFTRCGGGIHCLTMPLRREG